MNDLLALAQRLIAYDTSEPEAVLKTAGFVKGWLEARGIEAVQEYSKGLPVTMAEVGPAEGAAADGGSGAASAAGAPGADGVPTVVLHGHIDVVPGREGQFEPRLEGDRLIGRGAYDMKGALAAMMTCFAGLADQDRVRVRLAIVADEESEEEHERGSDHLVDAGFTGDFVITGEPTDLHIGIEAKGVLALRLEVPGRAAHGSTPWLGDNAVLKAIDVFRSIESLPFARESSELFDRPSINLGRIWGGDAFNKVPDRCVIDVDIRYLPDQDREAILAQIEEVAECRVLKTFVRPPAAVDADSVYVRALSEAVAEHLDTKPTSVGRDGASDVVSFLRAGVPAVEFGPAGGGHHGPEEWVSIQSLHRYRDSLDGFLKALPDRVGERDD